MPTPNLSYRLKIATFAIGISVVSSIAMGKSDSPEVEADMFTNPAFVENITSLIDPKALSGWMEVMKNPAALSNASQMDPAKMTAFMTVMTHPGFMQTIIDKADPNLLEGWLNIMANPTTMNSLIGALNPTMMEQWLKTLTNVQVMRPLMDGVDDSYLNQWIGAMTEPQMLDTMMKTMDPQLVMNSLGRMIPMMNNAASASAGSGDSE